MVYGVIQNMRHNVITCLDEVMAVPELEPVLWGAELPVVVVVELDELAFSTWYSSCKLAFSFSSSLKKRNLHSGINRHKPINEKTAR